jgi:hypothetical protein
MRILSVEAWADQEDSWTWNNWWVVGETEQPCETEEDAWAAFEEHFGKPLDHEKYEIIDDQYNYTLCIISEGHRPIFAVEYDSCY